MESYLYENEWKVIEGTQLTRNTINSYLSSLLERSLEKKHLYEIAEMLENEGFVPEEFWLIEYPKEGVYCIERIGEKRGIDYFTVQEDSGVLKPYYVTNEFINGINNFPCDSIKESIEKMEC